MAIPIESAGEGDTALSRHPAGVYGAHDHSLGQIVESDRKREHRGAAEPAFYPLGLLAVAVQVGDQPVKSKEEKHAEPKADGYRDKRPFPHIRSLLHGRDYQAPYRSGGHDAGGKTGKRSLERHTERLAHEKHAGRPESRSRKGDKQTL